LDVSKLHSFGWKHKISLEDGIRSVYEDVLTSKIFA
jgi:GDP-L-fucose synthase